MLNATLTRATKLRDPQKPWLGLDAEIESFPCRGFVESYSDFIRAGGGIRDTDSKIVVLADTLKTVPQPGDDIRIRGATYNVVDVRSDPARATYTLQGRR